MKGFHLMVDGKVNDPPTKEWLLEVMEELARLTNMNFILGPYVVEGIPENPGLTAIGVVDFSTISIHHFEKDNTVLIDVFTCKPFDVERVLDYLRKQFKVESTNYLERGW